MKRNPPTLVVTSLLLVTLLVTGAAAVTAAPTASIDGDPSQEQLTRSQANQQPTANFTYSPSSPKEDETVTFTADANDPDGSITQYEWKIDGTVVATRTDPEYTHTFSSSGDHEVNLTVTDNDSATASETKTVTVARNKRPNANDILVDPENPKANETVEFVANAADPDGEIVEYEWRVDGETKATRSYDGFSYNFSSAGNHTIRLVVTDDNGASDDVLKVVTVRKTDAPTAEIEYSPTNPEVDEAVSFAADASDPDGSIDSYQWEIDGTTVSTSRTHSHSFDSSGDHEVTLTVTDNKGATTTTNTTVTVSELAAPDFQVTIDATSSPITEGDDLSVTATVTNEGSKTDTQEVTLSVAGTTRDTRSVTLDGGRRTTLELTWETTDGDAGNYQARVSTANDSAATEVGIRAATPSNVAPSAGIEYSPTSPAPDDAVELVANASDSDGSVEAYEWTVDGEAVSTSETTTVTFSSAGDHEVTLTVTDDDGATATATRVVTVNAPPSVDVSSSTSSPNLGEPVTFTATVDDDGEIERYRWLVDGEEVGTSRTLNTTFDTAGEHEVTLQVTDDDGAVSSMTRTVEVGSASTDSPRGSGLPGLDEPLLIALAVIMALVVAAGLGARFL